MIFKKIVKFLCGFIVLICDFIKKFCKTMVFFWKKIEIFEIQNFNKIPLFTIFFLVFQHLWHFFFNFTHPTLSKNYGIFCSVLFEGLEILPTIFWKILKVISKKNIDMWNSFFFKILRFTICFFIFLLFLTF